MVDDKRNGKVPPPPVLDIRDPQMLGDWMRNPDSEFNKLSFAQQGWYIDYYINLKGNDAVKENFGKKGEGEWSKQSLRAHSWRLRKSLKVQNAVREMYELAGLDHIEIAAVIKRGLNAKKHFYNTKENSVLHTDVDDTATQLRAAKLAAEILGDIGGRKDSEKEGSTVNLTISIQALNEMEDAVKKTMEEKYGKKKPVEVEVKDLSKDQIT